MGWWLYVLALAGAAAFIAYSFIGILVLGLFGYYATRPIHSRLRHVVGSDRRAAMLTVSIILLPTLVLILYTGLKLFQQAEQILGESQVSNLATGILGRSTLPVVDQLGLVSVIENPLSSAGALQGSIWSNLGAVLAVFQAAFGAVVLLGLSIALSYALLSRGTALSDGLIELFGGRDTTAYAYAAAVDADLESVFFGNLLFVAVMSIVATATYGATNAVAPPEMQVPIVLVLGVLTGITSLIPLVVSKVVYLPVVAYLGVRAVQMGGDHLFFVGGVLVVYFLVLDIVPQSLLQPYLAGRHFDVLALFFAYIMGPILFGWYGFFLLPILFILLLETVRIVLPDLLHGDPVDAEPKFADDLGTDPNEARENDPAADEPESGRLETDGPEARPVATDAVKRSSDADGSSARE